MTKVLQIIADGNPGGGTTHVLQILNGLKNNFEYKLVTQSKSYLSKRAGEIGIDVFEVNFFTSRLDLRITYQLRKLHDEFKPDLVHVHGARAGWLISLSNLSTPLIYTVHGYHFLKKPLLQYHAAILIEKYISKKVDRIIFVSKYDIETAKKYRILNPRIHATVIYNGIALVDLNAAQSQPQHIGFIGRLVPQKDPYLFLEVVKRLPDYQATIIGGGELEKNIQKEIEKNKLTKVKMLGALPHDRLMDMLASFNTIVITSRWEGLPYLPLEAMWRQVPVVSVNVGGMGEIIDNMVNGILFDTRSPGELADAVRRLDSNPEFRETIVNQAKKHVQEEFSVDQMLGKLSSEYEQALG